MATLNLDIVTGRTVDISVTNADGEVEVYKLRGDVPSSILARTLYVQELEQQQPKMQIDITAPLDVEQIKDFEATLAEHESGIQAEMLAVCGAIWRWTDPSMTDSKLSELLSVPQQKDILTFFFTGLLARYGKLPQAATSASSSGDSPATSTPAPTTATEPTVSQDATSENSPTSKALDSTPLATPSHEDSSQELPESSESQESEPTETTAAEGTAAA